MALSGKIRIGTCAFRIAAASATSGSRSFCESLRSLISTSEPCGTCARRRAFRPATSPVEILVPPLNWLHGLCPKIGAPLWMRSGVKKRRNCDSALGGEFGGSSS